MILAKALRQNHPGNKTWNTLALDYEVDGSPDPCPEDNPSGDDEREIGMESLDIPIPTGKTTTQNRHRDDHYRLKR